MEIYYGITVYSTDEILMALLTQYEFESIEEHDDHFTMYVKTSTFDFNTRSEVEKLIQSYDVTYNIGEIQPQNWNAIWEASFQPVIVGSVCQVRADFHPPIADIQHDVIINPKMAFGTGHHATTYMMIEHMSDIDFHDKKVLDFGCGTGILAILASKCGAATIDAIDIEHESYLNTKENAEINDIKNIVSIEGELNAVPSTKYDIILANINRNILQKYSADLSSMLNPSGHLLISGILEEDSDQMIKTFNTEKIQTEKQSARDGWSCLTFILE